MINAATPEAAASARTNRFCLCSRCEKTKPIAGGVQLNATRWLCQSCWTRRATVGNLK